MEFSLFPCLLLTFKVNDLASLICLIANATHLPNSVLFLYEIISKFVHSFVHPYLTLGFGNLKATVHNFLSNLSFVNGVGDSLLLLLPVVFVDEEAALFPIMLYYHFPIVSISNTHCNFVFVHRPRYRTVSVHVNASDVK